MIKTIIRSCLAGLLIAFAGAIYLNCENKIVGSLLFSVGLISVILFQADLFTGKVGYIDSKDTLKNSIIILVVNLLVAFLVGLIYRFCIGETTAMDSRLDKNVWRLLFDSYLCGICIYAAVEGFKMTNRKSILVIIIPVMCFILGKGEHCVADAFYYGSAALTWKGLGILGIVVLGNSAGSLTINYLKKWGAKE